jgi:hypothetical protein
VSRKPKSLKIVEIPTISHYQPHVGVNQSKSSRKKIQKEKHEYFFRTFPADHLNSTPTPMNTAYIGRARPIAGTPSA